MVNKVIQFSGGKDSIVCMHLFKDEPDIKAMFVNTGAAYPHVVDFVTSTCEKFGVPLIIVEPEHSVIEWQKDNGFSADIVPWDSTLGMDLISKNNFGVMLTPYTNCCSKNIWEPMQKALVDNNVEFVIRGSKSCDSKVGVADGHIDDNGVYYNSPLWEWTDEDVFNYIAEYNIEIPDHYAKSKNSDSLDCWCCTAYMGKTGEARVSYTKEVYPELHKTLISNLAAVKATVANAVTYYYSEPAGD